LDFSYSERQRELIARVRNFMSTEVLPAVPAYEAQLTAVRWRLPPVVEELKRKARACGLWNLFLPRSENNSGAQHGPGLSNLEYAPLA
jgi:acyl-CoA dehydrogenase